MLGFPFFVLNSTDSSSLSMSLLTGTSPQFFVTDSPYTSSLAGMIGSQVASLYSTTANGVAPLNFPN